MVHASMHSSKLSKEDGLLKLVSTLDSSELSANNSKGTTELVSSLLRLLPKVLSSERDLSSRPGLQADTSDSVSEAESLKFNLLVA